MKSLHADYELRSSPSDATEVSFYAGIIAQGRTKNRSKSGIRGGFVKALFQRPRRSGIFRVGECHPMERVGDEFEFGWFLLVSLFGLSIGLLPLVERLGPEKLHVLAYASSWWQVVCFSLFPV